MKKRKDLRIIKTQNSLFNALTELMKEKTFDSIKVSDICDKALINRSTFYAHYTDKYELFIDYVNDLKIKLSKQLEKNNNIVNTKEYYIELIRLILDHIEEQKNIYYSVILNNSNSIIIDVIIDVTIKDINNRIEIDKLKKTNIPIDIIVDFYLGAVICVCIAWLKNNNKYTKDDILDYLSKLIPNNI